eukprot:UN22325
MQYRDEDNNRGFGFVLYDDPTVAETVARSTTFGRQKSIFSSSLLKNVGDDKNMTPEIWKSHRRTLSKAASVKNYDMISEMQQQVINAKKSVALNPESEFDR